MTEHELELRYHEPLTIEMREALLEAVLPILAHYRSLGLSTDYVFRNALLELITAWAVQQLNWSHAAGEAADLAVRLYQRIEENKGKGLQ